MQAIVLDEVGGIDKLTPRRWPDPIAGRGEAIVRVRASAVCGRDLIDRRGGFPALRVPIVLGHELAGEVVAVGPEVHRVACGDRVVNLHRGPCGACPRCLQGEPVWCDNGSPMIGQAQDGGYAELVRVPEGALVRIPESVSFVDAAPMMCTAGVALRALRHVGRLLAGQRLLVTGASGGVGMMAIQLAKRMGADVVALTRDPAKADALLGAGADGVIVGDALQARAELRTRYPAGFDVSLELTGSATFELALRALRRGGRLVLVGNILTQPVRLNPGLVILHGYHVVGSFSCDHADVVEVLGMIERKEIRACIHQVLPLGDVRRAHELLETGGVVGRVVLLP